VSGPPPVTGAALSRRRVAGVAFLLVISALVYLTVLMYQKAFTPVVMVSLEADRVGNQLSAHADVKLRGIVVGEVRDVSSRGEGATVQLALDPDKTEQIPANVTAQLLPKTLFGEKYVALGLPASRSGEVIEDGDVITQDRSSTAIETAQALDDLLPVLQSLHPDDLSTALNALSTALRDRGDRLGRSFATTAAYLRRFNPSVPQLGADMAALADVADTLGEATPDLLRTLDNLASSSRFLVQERAELDEFLATTRSFTASAQDLLDRSEKSLIRLAVDSQAPLQLFARYAPEYPCLLEALRKYDPIVSKTFGGALPGLHITVEATMDNGPYVPGQEPKYRDTRGPDCWGLPNPKMPAGDDKFDDGYRTETSTSSDALSLVMAPLLGVPPSEVPDLAGLLLGPIAGGSTVGLAA
jgi:phospholipid/cholesterol/gamma-HCH transport system substrate-binding protein